jgi:hypothetical protein
VAGEFGLEIFFGSEDFEFTSLLRFMFWSFVKLISSSGSLHEQLPITAIRDNFGIKIFVV